MHHQPYQIQKMQNLISQILVLPILRNYKLKIAIYIYIY